MGALVLFKLFVIGLTEHFTATRFSRHGVGGGTAVDHTAIAGDTSLILELLKLQKPAYPRIDLKQRHEDFLRTLELDWENRNAAIRHKAGLTNPKFQGGELSDFTYWVNSRLNYSAVEGIKDDVRIVVVEVVVAKDGTVRAVHALVGTNQQLNDEAVRVVKTSPKWTPAEYDGEKRNVKLSIPVLFEF